MSTTGGKIPSNIIGIGPGEHGEKKTPQDGQKYCAGLISAFCSDQTNWLVAITCLMPIQIQMCPHNHHAVLSTKIGPDKRAD